MVMAQVPSTQYVAHEFVRQYYTVLHKDPSQLHRFYTRESRLTHGVSPNAKSEDPVCGQEAINEKISQLHFRSCHARIRSVDSHPTIGGGVVIQVTGELSNAGMAMRKFMQTFVLAQQEPKKYHVFNDIFRYQDETFEDTENEGTANETAESENGYVGHESVTQPPLMTEPDQHVPSTETDIMAHIVNGEDKLYCDIEKEDVDEEEVEDIPSTQQPDQEYTEENVEGVAEEEEEEDDEEEEEFSTPVQTPATESAKVIAPEKTEDDGTEFKEYEDVKVEETVAEEKSPETDTATEKQPTKAVTWAALAKKNTPTPVATPPSGSPNSNTKPQQQVQKKENRPPKKREEQPPVSRKEQTEEPKRRSNPDHHQIFIGNLPNTIAEKDVREAFNEYGNIVEVRLNAKNFGFVAFDGPDPPTNILQKKPTISIHGHTINTEVKRSVSGNRGNAGRDGGGRDGGGFRRGDRDSNRNRGDMSKSSGRSGGSGGGGGQNRLGGKNSQHSQKQRNNNDDSKTDKNKDSKTQRDQRQSRR